MRLILFPLCDEDVHILSKSLKGTTKFRWTHEGD